MPAFIELEIKVILIDRSLLMKRETRLVVNLRCTLAPAVAWVHFLECHFLRSGGVCAGVHVNQSLSEYLSAAFTPVQAATEGETLLQTGGEFKVQVEAL